MYSHIDNYEERALDRNIEFFKGLVNWGKLLTIYAQDSQEVEDILQDFHDKLNVQFGEGTTLDVFGKIFQVSRGNLSDNEYKNLILTAYAEFNESGQIETVISVYKSLMLATKVTLIEYFPASFIANAEVESPLTTITDFVREAINNIKAAGIEIELTASQNFGAFKFISIGDLPGPDLGFAGLGGQDLFEILTETGDTITTEAGDQIITEGITSSVGDGGVFGFIIRDITNFNAITEAGDNILTEAGDQIITERFF